MEQKTKNTLKVIAGVVGVVLLYRIFLKPNKKKEKKSNFIGSPFGKRVMFTLKNTSSTKEVVPMFNAYSNIQNPKVNITPSISEFNRTLLNEPKKVKAIEIRAVGNQKQAQQPIQIYQKDASGDFKSKYIYPMVSAYQAQKGMTTVEPKNLVLNGGKYLNYTVNPNATVTMIVHYEEVSKSDLLKSSNKQKQES